MLHQGGYAKPYHMPTSDSNSSLWLREWIPVKETKITQIEAQYNRTTKEIEFK